MTPTEKAKQIYEDMYYRIMSANGNVRHSSAIMCAKFCVKEIMLGNHADLSRAFWKLVLKEIDEI